MEVVLVIPPSGFLLDERVFPSLGVLKVAATLEQGGVQVRVVDLSGRGDDHETLFRAFNEELGSFPVPHVVGITATMPQMPSAARIAEFVREMWPPETRVILGGPHVTLMRASERQELARGKPGRAHACMKELLDRFDTLVCGDGERAIWGVLTPLRLGARPPALIDADDPKGPLFLTPTDLNEAPFPARHLIDLNSYHYTIDGYPTHSLIGQLGCPMGCAFCGGRRSPFLRRVRMRSSEQVVAEVRHLHDQHGARGLMFLDDELNVNRQFLDLLRQLRDLQSTLGVDLKFRGLLKSELLTEDMARDMAATGFRQILVGFESGDERILKNMRKNATRDDNTRCVALLRKYGIKVKALMSVGHAGETPETIAATRDWLLEVQPDDFDVTIITVYPGTPYYDDAVEVAAGPIPGKFQRQKGVVVEQGDIWTYTDPKNGDRLHALDVDHLRDVNFYKGIPGEYQSFVWTDALSQNQLVELRDAVEAEVRGTLHIPYPAGPAAKQYEHSMGLR